MKHKQITRRRFLATAFGSETLTPLADTSLHEKPKTDQPATSPLVGVDGRTPIDFFYRQQLRSVPQITPVFWALRVYGMVEKPLTLTYEDLPQFQTTDLDCTLACIGSSARNPMIGHALWSGIPIAPLLERINPSSKATYAQLYAADGYTTYIEVDKLERALLAYRMNGETLPREHGYPARLIVPGLYGYKMPKWIQRIELTDRPAPGFWEKRGWSASGDVQTMSTILTPHHLETIRGTTRLSGIAYAGGRTLSAVELSVNDSPWMPVEIASNQAAQWTPWQIDWTPPGPGDYLIKVRATDNSGYTQVESASAFPNGPTAIHSIILRVSD